MALVDHNGEAEFPVSRDNVFDAMCLAIPTIKGLQIDSADKFLGRIVVKGSVSLASWGENVPIQLTSVDANRTRVSITSSPKTGIMFGGANDMGKNRKNIERILSATSQTLQRQVGGHHPVLEQQGAGQPQPSAPYQQPSFNQPIQAAKKKKMGIGKKILIGIGAFVALGVIGNLAGKGKSDGDASSASAASETAGASSEAPAAVSATSIGQPLHTEYFDVTANKVSVEDKVKTGNQFADLKAEPGNKYLIINATFKNTDKESRMISDGSVFITYNGKEYNFDKSETVLLDGWGTMLDQLNPLTTKTTNLVYKIPDEIKGRALWNPGRSDRDQTIDLGEIN